MPERADGEPALLAALGEIRRRMAPRCLVPAAGDTLRAAHVQYAEPAAPLEAPRLAIVTVLKREDGRDVVATRLLPVKALEGVDDAAEDISRVAPEAILRHWSEAWTRGADLAPRLYEERRQAYWALARRRLRAAVPDAPPLDVLEAEALAAARAFCRHLAPPVRDALGLMETLWRRPNIVAIQTIANDIAARRHPERFAQAFRAAPYLAWLMTRPGLGETPAWLAASVGDAIDAGTAPADVVRAVCQPESKRQVRGFDVKAVMALADGFERGITLAHVLAILGDAFPQTHRRAPPTPPDIAALVYAVCDICGSVAWWAGSARRIAACLARGAAIEPLPATCADAFRWYATQAGRAGLDLATAHAAALDAFFPAGGRRARLAALDARWHRAAERLFAEEEAIRFEHYAGLAQVDPAALFPPPPPFEVPAGLRVEVLASSERCRREGVEMRHCVATYRDRAAAGAVLLLSIADADADADADLRRRSTASLAVDLAEAHVRLGQVRGPANATPPAAHVAFARDLETQVGQILAASTAAGARWRAALAAAARAAAAVEAIERGAVMAPALADARFELLRPFLPRAERAMARADWLAHRKASGAS